jgi:hypothetical protein
MMNDFIEFLKYIGDVISVSVLIGYFVSALPVVATLLTVVWTALRIYQEPIIQRWITRKKSDEPPSR